MGVGVLSADLSGWLDRVTLGDCLEVLRELPDCSVDLCATDPPYGIAFMARGWDQEIPARAIWAEVLRVLKPEGSCFVCAGSRQDTILGLLTDLREVGFDIQHAALSWVYWSGFPKSTDVGKDFDKAAFLSWVKRQPLTMLPECPFEHKHKGFAARKVECPECKRRAWALRAGYSDEVTRADVRKAASAAVNGAYSAEPAYDVKRANSHGAEMQIAGGNLRPHNYEAAAGHPGTGTLLLAALQARFGDAPGVRAKVGTKADPRYASPREKAVFSVERQGYDDGSTAGTGSGDDHPAATITSPATPDAIAWDGWHSGSVPLKPSSEQILWVTKPAEPGPARGNVLKWGTGAVNVGECRVPFEPEGPEASGSHWGGSQLSQNGSEPVPLLQRQHAYQTSKQDGRYPSNLLVTARALGDDSKYGDLDAWAREHWISDEWLDAALSAGVLRVSKPSRSEKNAGCEGVGFEGKGRWNKGGEFQEVVRERGNNHATVKPVTLFAFLCTLACPRGGVVLDPFGGSGTTGVAATQCGMHWVLIEREAEYCTIAEARTDHAKQQARRAHQPALDLQEATAE